MAKQVLIVGGVAGGASCAARLRRMDEQCEITLLERGPYVSFANCGLPYYVGGVIQDEKKLLVATPSLFRDRFRIGVLTEHEAVSIDRSAKTVRVKNPKGDSDFPYDILVLATGTAPVKPPLPGLDLPGVFMVRTLPDSRAIREWIQKRSAHKAVVVGAGFIGLETAENLMLRGLEVEIVEAGSQVLPPLDAEMTPPLHQHLESKGIRLHLKDPLAAIEPAADGMTVNTQGGKSIPADLVILSIGVKPESSLARSAGLKIGLLGGVRVDEQMRTSDPSIYAVGDMVEVKDYVTGAWTLVPLAGPANRQGRLAADSIAGKSRSFRGVQGTSVVGVFGLTAAWTGATEKTLKKAGLEDYGRVYLHPAHHATYHPGAKTIHLKLLFDQGTGRVLGAQAVGEEGVEKRIDVIAMAIQMGAKVTDLEEAELCYAPPYGSAKDPVNLAGMIAANHLRGDSPTAPWEELESGKPFLLDVRSAKEHAATPIPGAVNIPVDDLRGRLAELPKDREIWVHCGVGQRSHVAVRILRQNGLKARNLPGGYQTWKMFHPLNPF